MNTPAPLAATSRLDDATLAQAIAGGDTRAFEQLMRQHNRRLYRLARAALRDAAEAQDALQDAYLSAWRKIGQYRGEAALATWLSRMVLNECLERLRRTRRRNIVVPLVSAGDDSVRDAVPGPAALQPDRQLGRGQLRELLEQRLDALPEAFRIVFVLRSVEELSVEETAASLGVAEATVRTRHHRARALLRESLARELDLAEQEVYGFGGEHCDRVITSVMARIASGG